MTAISIAYDPVLSHFIAAADGRSASATAPIEIETESQRKIFNIQYRHISFGYAFAGFAHTRDNSFSTIDEAAQQIQSLIKRPFHDGYELCQKFVSNLARVFEKARGEGRIQHFPKAANRAANKQDLILVLISFGFFKDRAFFRTAFLHYDEEDGKVSVTYEKDLPMSQFHVVCIGSDLIKQMFYGLIPFDKRLAGHEYVMGEHSTAFDAATKYVEICSLPRASEVDPWCQAMGGLMHVAELNKNEFKWIVAPRET